MGPVMGSDTMNFRLFREGDEAAILRTLNEMSDVGCSLDVWAWLFPPEEGGRAIVVGERHGEVAAVCAGVPIRVAVDGREWPAVDVRKLVSRDRDDIDRVLDYFVETFGSNGRFVLAIASFWQGEEASSGFNGAAKTELEELVRERPVSASPRRFLYRAEPARDWESRLDALWERARSSYPVSVVRRADYASRRFAGHPVTRHHRFLVFPRYSRKAVAFAVFGDDGSSCCWLDLLWDHAHRGALDLLAHISGRLAAQWGSSGERLWLAGDGATRSLLIGRGFRAGSSSSSLVGARSFTPEFDARDFVGRAYLTAADAAGLGP
jgi:hypothetical protein